MGRNVREDWKWVNGAGCRWTETNVLQEGEEDDAFEGNELGHGFPVLNARLH